MESKIENMFGSEEKNLSEEFKINYKKFLEETGLSDLPAEEDEEILLEADPEAGSMLEKKILDKPDFLNDFFEKKGYASQKPKPIANRKGTTLFITAGVQAFENVIFNERDLEQAKIFVAQPVFRTQFINQIGEGFSSSFINISTGIVKPSIQEHFKSLGEWVEFLGSIGLKKDYLVLKLKENTPTWGDKTFKNVEIMLSYKGLEIGDANFIHDVPQASRDNLSISDIGFGLERINWLQRGGSYFERNDLSMQFQDHIKTLALLAGSGVKPSNKEQGYRFRQLSKNIISSGNIDESIVEDWVRACYREWKKWTFLEIPESGAVKSIVDENERNRKAK